MLDSAVKTNPNTTWWIKGDGCDVVPGICESVQMVWSGDVYLNDGELQEAYQLYRKKLKFISGIGVKGNQTKAMILEDLKALHQQILSDKDFATKFIWCVH